MQKRSKVKLQLLLKKEIPKVILILIGLPLITLGLKGFLIPNGFIDGGMMGASLLLSRICQLPLWMLIILTNASFILIGYNRISKMFGAKTILAIAGLALWLAFSDIPAITQDHLLASVFGGVFIGAGLGFAIRGGAVCDGTDVLALYINRKTGFTIGDCLLVINIIIFSLASLILNIEAVLYSILTYFSASRTVDFVIQGIEEYIGVTIISARKSEEIKHMIITKLARGVTLYKGSSGYGKKGHNTELDIIYTVMTRLEISRLKTEIDLIDRQAFIVEQAVREITGGVVKKRPQHII
jgi:uncharacterized membrane-anchored protein YitT (DUF2179 family)